LKKHEKENDHMTILDPKAPGTHELPPLPYPYDAMEPVIDAKTMEIHHDRHHKKYVDDLNKAELALVDVREKKDYDKISFWENQLAFNGSGHILHSIYWTIMAAPGTGGAPGEYTRAHIDWYFGGLDALKEQFTEAAKKVQGSGWAILGYQPAFARLEVLQLEKHQNMTQQGVIPILVCDVWEHAYYLKYQNNRDQFVDAWWTLVNWDEVERRLIDAVGGALPLKMKA